ncbi:hypothetical protein K466DRAFT_223436 [Polyporus arcularius HHB13444]|uniref:Uncharacterized protein n=1 Tax=Polyporus arcularius HHB13444 TaxID=1314778 RepID=A0A5C3PSP7_9APHY|nr:hypothetical protein K466DRAFT_223436 [Polyporus arcularius HHB13444]
MSVACRCVLRRPVGSDPGKASCIRELVEALRACMYVCRGRTGDDDQTGTVTVTVAVTVQYSTSTSFHPESLLFAVCSAQCAVMIQQKRGQRKYSVLSTSGFRDGDGGGDDDGWRLGGRGGPMPTNRSWVDRATDSTNLGYGYAPVLRVRKCTCVRAQRGALRHRGTRSSMHRASRALAPRHQSPILVIYA